MGSRSRAPRHLRLSSEAAFAAERLAEIAGLPASELVEMVLLELAASGEIVDAGGRAKGKRSRPVARRGPAPVISIERGRRRVPPGGPIDTLRQRSEVARRRSEAARETSVALRLKCRTRPGAAW